MSNNGTEILDSGEREEFSTGAVRDSGKEGRCDLLPLKVVGGYLNYTGPEHGYNIAIARILSDVEGFQRSLNIEHLWRAIQIAIRNLQMFPDTPTAMLEVSVHYAQGAEKHSEWNWQKGIPLHSYIDRGVRHLLKWLRGDLDERHDRAFIWNMLGAIWTVENKPELSEKLVDGEYVIEATAVSESEHRKREALEKMLSVKEIDEETKREILCQISWENRRRNNFEKNSAGWLKAHGFDGLYTNDVGDEPCWCEIDALCPCGGEGALDCIQGYRHELKDGQCDDCSKHCCPNESADFIICGRKGKQL
jgi:hypothetical protein